MLAFDRANLPIVLSSASGPVDKGAATRALQRVREAAAALGYTTLRLSDTQLQIVRAGPLFRTTPISRLARSLTVRVDARASSLHCGFSYEVGGYAAIILVLEVLLYGGVGAVARNIWLGFGLPLLVLLWELRSVGHSIREWLEDVLELDVATSPLPTPHDAA